MKAFVPQYTRLVLHIGTDKAGSTALQSHLWANRQYLGEQGICVPQTGLGPDNGHAELFSTVGSSAWDELRTELKQMERAPRLVVLSWEGLNFYSAPELKSLARQLPELPVTVLAYLREQAEVVQSGFLQEIKRLANTCPISTFQSHSLWLRMRQQRRARYPATRNYYQLLRRWETALPGAEISVRLFDRQHMKNGDVVADFFELLGLEPGAGFKRLAGLGNPSLDALSAYLLDQLRQSGVERGELERLVDVALSLREKGDTSWFLDQATVAAIRRHFDPSNRAMAKRYLGQADNPFNLDRPAWAKGGEAGLRADLLRQWHRLQAADRINSYSGEGLSGADIAGAGFLLRGWEAEENWGSWSNGVVSHIEFRVLRQRLLPQHETLHIYIRGRYREVTGRTRVTINGLDFGCHRLGHERPGLNLPIAELGQTDSVNIELHHEGEFGLEFFGFEPLPT